MILDYKLELFSVEDRLRLDHSLFLPTQSKRIGHRPESQTPQQLIKPQSTQQAIYNTTQSESIQQATNQSQHTIQQQAHRRNDLTQWFREQRPQRVELFLRVRHVRNALLRIVNCRTDSFGQLLQLLRQRIFLLGRLVGGSAGFGVGCDVAVRVEGADRPIAFLENAAAFFEEGFYLFDEPFFIEFLLGGAVCAFDVLRWC